MTLIQALEELHPQSKLGTIDPIELHLFIVWRRPQSRSIRVLLRL